MTNQPQRTCAHCGATRPQSQMTLRTIHRRDRVRKRTRHGYRYVQTIITERRWVCKDNCGGFLQMGMEG